MNNTGQKNKETNTHSNLGLLFINIVHINIIVNF